MARVFVLPIMRESEYQAFQRFVGLNLPDTYDEWQKLFADAVAEALRLGGSIVEIEVRYDEFIQACRSERREPDLKGLLEFTERKKAAWKSE